MREYAHRHMALMVMALVLPAMLTLAACSGRQTQPGIGGEPEANTELPRLEPAALGAGEKLRVVASTNIVGDVVSQVGGDAIDLTVLMGLGQDPHSYEPTPADLARIEMAHVAFVNGFDLEEGLLGVLEPLDSGVPIVPVSAGIETRAFEGEDEHAGESGEEGGEHAHEGGDPHTWMDPNNVEIWAANIAQVLSGLDPANADTYQANAATYVEQLQELDAYIDQQVSRIPPARRKLVTNHESVGYFADRYGFEVVGTVFIGPGELAEPSAGDLAELIETIRAEDVRAIFVETTVSRQLAEVVADEVGYEVGIYTLYTGSLGEPGSGADTYIGMMRFNVDTIVADLQ